ncbi:hypothetical protein KFE94_17520 [bacterium SCSIO 12643]|nr:hypothetical protein KFE94_17520 [bacterium SCSIO 12643]
MNNLIIIGNGFDLAHGLKTSYWHFINYLFNEELKNKEKFPDLLVISDSNRVYKSFDDWKKYSRSLDEPFGTDNYFFRKITNELITNNWCDIETQYFLELLIVGELSKRIDPLYENPEKLNEDFEIVKKYLSEFLKQEQRKFKPISVFKEFFNSMVQQGDLMILNFNYTDSIKQYLKYVKNADRIQLVQIHGEIDSNRNPIIFGYAANNEDSRELLGLGNKEYLRNIKKHNYKRTNEENRLKDFLEKGDIEVSIIGHSCGLSDKLILNQIFNEPNVKTIRPYYYQSYEHHFETSVNIDRIMDNDENFKKVVNFEESVIIPQTEDLKSQELFVSKVEEIIKEKDRQV